jgi:hypothetical protein
VSGFFERENRARTPAYRKDTPLERALLDVNRALAEHEPSAPADLDPLPTIFVFGIPRSGTTLLHQLLTLGLDVGYVSNVMARFWLAPHAGAIVSRAVLGRARDASFVSDYGETLDPAGGHEFAYFWNHWLSIHDIDDVLDFSGDSARADWEGVAAAVMRIRAAFDRPLVFKTNYAGQFLPAFARTFAMPLFVYVRRDPWPVARSILEARRRIYGDTATWWSTYPPEYAVLCERPAAEQIAGQVAGLRRTYAAQIAKVPADLVVEVGYDELCERPAAVIEIVRRRCREVHGTAPDLLHPVPDHFERSNPGTPDSEEELALAVALERALGEVPA